MPNTFVKAANVVYFNSEPQWFQCERQTKFNSFELCSIGRDQGWKSPQRNWNSFNANASHAHAYMTSDWSKWHAQTQQQQITHIAEMWLSLVEKWNEWIVRLLLSRLRSWFFCHLRYCWLSNHTSHGTKKKIQITDHDIYTYISNSDRDKNTQRQ